MRPEGPKEADVNYLVRERKFITHMPEVTEGAHEFRMQAVVYRKSSGKKTTGLMIMARAKKSPTGVPRPYPSSALVLDGRFRVRGLNNELWHDNPDGSIVKGWHEHIWINEYEDKFVRSARPKPRDLTIRGLFEWGLRKWNIRLEDAQLKVSHGSKK
jgi:hypothetical protein